MLVLLSHLINPLQFVFLFPFIFVSETWSYSRLILNSWSSSCFYFSVLNMLYSFFPKHNNDNKKTIFLDTTTWQEKKSPESRCKSQGPTCAHRQHSLKKTKLVAITYVRGLGVGPCRPLLAASVSLSSFGPCLVDSEPLFSWFFIPESWNLSPSFSVEFPKLWGEKTWWRFPI